MKKIHITLLCIFLFTNFLFAQDLKREWIALNRDSTANFLAFNDMAVDGDGNTYIAGYETDPGDKYYQTHFYLLKVNAAGDTQWKRNFNKKKDSIDEAIAIAVDASGYVYVTGTRIDTFCNICTYSTKISDIITMKYDATGKRIWLNRYHDSAYLLAAPSDITLSSDGTILITGNERHYEPKIGTEVSKLLLQKIKANGETKWVRKMRQVVGNYACFDYDNNIIVAGASDMDNLYQTQRPMVLKFDTKGQLIWSSIFTENNKYGRFSFVGCDSANNIYANGQTDTLTFYNNPRILTVKYNTGGLQQWFAKETNHTTSMLRFQGDFKIDAAGNSYVAGFVSKSSIDDDWIISKYDNAGRKRWTVTYNDSLNGSDAPNGLAVDTKGNVFVTGHVSKKGGYAIGIAAYNRKGEFIGLDMFSKTESSNAFPVGIGIDKNNNVYVGGFNGYYGHRHPESVVIKYSVEKSLIASNVFPKVINEVNLFPNPVNSSLHLTFATSSLENNYNLIISDVSGNVVLAKQSIKAEKIMNLNVNVQQLKQGVYTATISNGINTVSKTFIKE